MHGPDANSVIHQSTQLDELMGCLCERVYVYVYVRMYICAQKTHFLAFTD